MNKRRIKRTADGYMYSPVSEEERVLKEADLSLRGAQKTLHGTIVTKPGETDEAFGDYMKSPTFRKGLNKLQQKRKVTMLA